VCTSGAFSGSMGWLEALMVMPRVLANVWLRFFLVCG
jgi:hypothetical protein